jgi:hypothetical protein
MSFESVLCEPSPHDRRSAGETERALQAGQISRGMKIVIVVLLFIVGILHVLGYRMMATASTTPNEAPALRLNGD